MMNTTMTTAEQYESIESLRLTEPERHAFYKHCHDCETCQLVIADESIKYRDFQKHLCAEGARLQRQLWNVNTRVQ